MLLAVSVTTMPWSKRPAPPEAGVNPSVSRCPLVTQMFGPPGGTPKPAGIVSLTVRSYA